MGRCGAARPGPRRAGPRARDGHAGSPGTRPPPASGTGRPRSPAGSRTGPGRENGPGSGVDWVTMSDSCHTEWTQIGETPGSQPRSGRQSSENAFPSGLFGNRV